MPWKVRWRLEVSEDCPKSEWPLTMSHDDVIKWKYFPRYWPFVWGIHRSPVNSPHKGQWHGVLMFSLIRAWINGWVNNREAGDLRRHHTHYDAIIMALPTQTVPEFLEHVEVDILLMDSSNAFNSTTICCILTKFRFVIKSTWGFFQALMRFYIQETQYAMN